MCNQKSTMPNPSTQSDSPFVTVSVTVSASITVSVSASVSASVSFAAAVPVSFAAAVEGHYADGAVSVTWVVGVERVLQSINSSKCPTNDQHDWV